MGNQCSSTLCVTSEAPKQVDESCKTPRGAAVTNKAKPEEHTPKPAAPGQQKHADAPSAASTAAPLTNPVDAVSLVAHATAAAPDAPAPAPEAAPQHSSAAPHADPQHKEVEPQHKEVPAGHVLKKEEHSVVDEEGQRSRKPTTDGVATQHSITSNCSASRQPFGLSAAASPDAIVDDVSQSALQDTPSAPVSAPASRTGSRPLQDDQGAGSKVAPPTQGSDCSSAHPDAPAPAAELGAGAGGEPQQEQGEDKTDAAAAVGTPEAAKESAQEHVPAEEKQQEPKANSPTAEEPEEVPAATPEAEAAQAEAAEEPAAAAQGEEHAAEAAAEATASEEAPAGEAPAQEC